MKFGINGLNLLRERISCDTFLEKARMNPEAFTRTRKMGARELVYYCLNKKGLCTNMETNNFFDKIGKDEGIRAQSLFDQRKKLSPLVFSDLNDSYLDMFYSEYSDEARLFKGYVILAIDGSDIEVPNTRACLENYGLSHNGRSGVARAGVSICFDLLNHYILDGLIDRYRAPEILSAMKHIDKVKNLPIPQIYIMDRNYVSLGFMQFFEERNLKFLCRLKANSHYIKETAAMVTQDEIVEIKHTKHRRHRSRYATEEQFQTMIGKPHTRVRIVKYQLSTGEMEYLITNIEDFSYDDIVKLYNARWSIMLISALCAISLNTL